MKILKKKKKKKNIFFGGIRIFFFSNWEKSHLNPIGKGAECRPLRTPKKIPVNTLKSLLTRLISGHRLQLFLINPLFSHFPIEKPKLQSLTLP